MSDNSAPATAASLLSVLLPVLTGGLIGIVGSLGGPFVLQRVKDTAEKKRKRAEKFEELVAALYEHKHWLHLIEDIRVFGADLKADISPLAKVRAISAIYFPATESKLKELEDAAARYELWMTTAAQLRVRHPQGLPNSDGIADVYRPYSNAFASFVNELQDIARRELQ